MTRYTTTTRNSYGSRIGGALKGLIIGPILIIVAVGLLWWNEGRAVQRTKDLNTTEKNLVILDTPSYDSQNDGNLIHTRGSLTGGEIQDDVFGISKDAVLLERIVEMYQWEEQKREQRQDNLGGSETVTTTYDYRKVWSDRAIDSSRFNQSQTYINPSMPLNNRTIRSDAIRFEDFTLSSSLQSTLRADKNVSLHDVSGVDGYMISGNYFTTAQSIQNPEIGDIRVSFKYLASPTTVSVLAGQKSGALLDDFQAQYTSVSRIMIGNHSPEAMFQALHSENTFLTWILRGVSFFVMYMGFSMFFSIVPIIAAVVPIFKSILGFGVGLISFVLTLILWLTVMIIAWIFARPLIAILALIVVGALVYFLIQRKKSIQAIDQEAQVIS